MRPSLRLVPLAFLALTAVCCGGGQSRGSPFDPGWRDDHGAAMTAFARTFRGNRVPAGADVAVGVVGRATLVGVPLDGGAAWKVSRPLHGRPALAGAVVVAAGGGEVFALDARTGKLLWSRPSGGRIRGAGDDGVTTVVSLVPSTGLGSVVLAITRDGSVVRQMEDGAVIGVPAVVGDTVFLPWQGRYLSIYDLVSGEERARADMGSPTHWASAVGGAVFVGDRAATRFDERIALAGCVGAGTVALPTREAGLADDPVWLWPGAEGADRDARDEVRLYARPAAAGPGVDGGRFAATSFRVALGFDARTGARVWEHAHDADFLGGAACAGGFALCDARGVVTFLEGNTGAVAGRAALGQPVDACLVQTDALALPRSSPTPKPR